MNQVTKPKSLRQIIDERGDRYEYEQIDTTHLLGVVVGGGPRIIKAILERTAVVHPLNDDRPDVRSVVSLHKVQVWPQDITWMSRPSVMDFR